MPTVPTAARDRCRPRPATAPAFSLIELLVVLAIATVLLAVVGVGLSQSRAAARRVECLVHLRSIHGGLMAYAQEHGAFPHPAVTGVSWEKSALTYFDSARVLRCPDDAEIFTVTGSSYDWRDTGDPASTLAGRPLVRVGHEDLVLSFDALPGWHDPAGMNVVRLNGTAAAVPADAAIADLLQPISGNAPTP